MMYKFHNYKPLQRKRITRNDRTKREMIANENKQFLRLINFPLIDSLVLLK